jgi:hypothetical protein
MTTIARGARPVPLLDDPLLSGPLVGWAENFAVSVTSVSIPLSSTIDDTIKA